MWAESEAVASLLSPSSSFSLSLSDYKVLHIPLSVSILGMVGHCHFLPEGQISLDL